MYICQQFYLLTHIFVYFQLVRSDTEETWTQAWAVFQKKYFEKKRVLDYITRQWSH